MEKKFSDITEIHTLELFKQVSEYTDALIDVATANGSLEVHGADNEYTREIGRVGRLCTDYESMYMKFEHLVKRLYKELNIEPRLILEFS